MRTVVVNVASMMVSCPTMPLLPDIYYNCIKPRKYLSIKLLSFVPTDTVYRIDITYTFIIICYIPSYVYSYALVNNYK